MLWSIGRYDLRLGKDEFGRLTMRELDALLKRHSLNVKRWDNRFAVLCALIAEPNRDPKKRSTPFIADDFMPSEEPKEAPKQTPEEILTMAKMFTIRSGGVIGPGE